MQFIARLLASWRSLSSRVHLGIGIGALVILSAITAGYFMVRNQPAPQTAIAQSEYPSVSVANTYEEGVHTIAGTMTLRNRCQRFDSSSYVDDSTSPATIRVELSSPYDEGICLEIPETHEFSLSVPAEEGATVEVYVNGIPSSGAAL